MMSASCGENVILEQKHGSVYCYHLNYHLDVVSGGGVINDFVYIVAGDCNSIIARFETI